jgi:hypothetical protein
MQKITILIFFLLTFSIYSFDNHHLGVKLGGTYSKLDVHDYYDEQLGVNPETSFYWGTYFGVYDQINLMENISLLFELTYNQKGVKIFDNKDLYRSPSYKRKTLAGVEFVMALNLNFKNVYLNLGVFYDVNLYFKTLFDDGHTSDIDNSDFGGDLLYNDKGILLGLGYVYDNFLFELRFSKGFNTVVDFRYDSEPETSDYYDNSIQYLFSVGYQFF